MNEKFSDKVLISTPNMFDVKRGKCVFKRQMMGFIGGEFVIVDGLFLLFIVVLVGCYCEYGNGAGKVAAVL